MSEQLFTPEEQAVREKILSHRVGIMDALTENGVPTDSKTVRLLEVVMTATDEQVIRTAELRQRSSDTQSNQELTAAVLEGIRASKRANALAPVADPSIVIDAEVIATAITDGGDILNMEDFVGGDDD